MVRQGWRQQYGYAMAVRYIRVDGKSSNNFDRTVRPEAVRYGVRRKTHYWLELAELNHLRNI